MNIPDTLLMLNGVIQSVHFFLQFLASLMDRVFTRILVQRVISLSNFKCVTALILGKSRNCSELRVELDEFCVKVAFYDVALSCMMKSADIFVS